MPHHKMTEPAEGYHVLLVKFQFRGFVKRLDMMHLQALIIPAPLADGFCPEMLRAGVFPLRGAIFCECQGNQNAGENKNNGYDFG